MDHIDIKHLVSLLEERNKDRLLYERDLAEQKEELEAQKEELTSAIEELVVKNNSLAEAMQSLTQRNYELDQILYRTSHDLKTPVSSLQGLIDVLKSEPLTQEQETVVGFMQQKVVQMNSILKSLTMLAQASFEKITPKAIDVAKLVQQVMIDLAYLPNASHVDVKTNYNNVNSVLADDLVLYNIIKSLLSNAITFRDPLIRGTIEVDFFRNDRGFVVEVRDDGEGIASDIAPRIFNMFFRGSERSLGSGLGLYIVKSIVERSKGEIQWSSKSGKTTFTVTLPES